MSTMHIYGHWECLHECVCWCLILSGMNKEWRSWYNLCKNTILGVHFSSSDDVCVYKQVYVNEYIYAFACVCFSVHVRSGHVLEATGIVQLTTSG